MVDLPYRGASFEIVPFVVDDDGYSVGAVVSFLAGVVAPDYSADVGSGHSVAAPYYSEIAVGSDAAALAVAAVMNCSAFVSIAVVAPAIGDVEAAVAASGAVAAYDAASGAVAAVDLLSVIVMFADPGGKELIGFDLAAAEPCLAAASAAA